MPPIRKHDELMNFMFAGHDTTANTMCWALYELARNPAVQVSRAFKRATL